MSVLISSGRSATRPWVVPGTTHSCAPGIDAAISRLWSDSSASDCARSASSEQNPPWGHHVAHRNLIC
jgi:hypothetical protein